MSLQEAELFENVLSVLLLSACCNIRTVATSFFYLPYCFVFNDSMSVV